MKAPLLTLLLAPIVLLSSPGTAVAQSAATTPDIHCSLLPLDPEARTAHVPLVLEGEVLSSKGMRTSAGRIYTTHRVRVYKLLKGTAPAEITLMTEGGTVGLERQEITNTLRLTVGEQGVFFLEPAAFPGTGAAGAWSVYASQQGFVRYELHTATAIEPYHIYTGLGTSLYRQLGNARPREVQPNVTLTTALRRQTEPIAAKVAAPVVTSLAPLSLTAGTGAVLTIRGTGFGATRGTGFVEFRNADVNNSFTKAADRDYVSWSDTEIRVTVPSISASGNTAGTGPVRITSTDQLTTQSVSSVTVVFAASNVQDEATSQRVIPGHLNQNGTGGYTFRFDPTFDSNTSATTAWRRALANWRCQTGINWVVGTTRTKSGVADDGENAVGFDSGTTLPANVLGRTTSYYRGCYQADGSVSFYVQEIDTEFDDATNWQFGPGTPNSNQIDFESVALHELGHAQQLSHLILPSAVMHYAIARGQVSRTLAAPSDIAGGRYVLRRRGFLADECGVTPMLPAPLTSQFARYEEGAGVVVQWSTQNECFVTEFVVERAPSDTTRAWQAVATVRAGAGPVYRYTDPQPLSGMSYYRVRVRRPDTSLDTPTPTAVTDDATIASGVQFYPNPLTNADLLRLQYVGGGLPGTLTLRFYDAVGRYLRGTVIRYQPGLNTLAVEPPYLSPGWYIIRWNDSEGPSGTSRLVKID
ncbi:matrixin family metalloprotease [Hymenobacter mucosus]|uniref:IPT/TIG domain-containing protein n=1 Tax=Hymenobacter mucosus TaxID=1411120 RepID=A0A238YWX2_9BACT|nr:matrixin family metalloprotease [Hymenobacter mucosus]SNR75570.1 IPT/TIG domain-containing protein [Hymenobacter mucosus]